MGIFDCFQRTQVLLKFARVPSCSILTLLAHRDLMIATFTGPITIFPCQWLKIFTCVSSGVRNNIPLFIWIRARTTSVHKVHKSMIYLIHLDSFLIRIVMHVRVVSVLLRHPAFIHWPLVAALHLPELGFLVALRQVQLVLAEVRLGLVHRRNLFLSRWLVQVILVDVLRRYWGHSILNGSTILLHMWHLTGCGSLIHGTPILLKRRVLRCVSSLESHFWRWR